MITDVEAVDFSNRKIRTVAEQMAVLYNKCKEVVAEWNATGMSAKLTNDSEPVVDGADSDGRHPIVGSDANNIINRCTEFITDYEATSNAKLNTVLKVARTD